jgi:hypothetical protein
VCVRVRGARATALSDRRATAVSVEYRDGSR